MPDRAHDVTSMTVGELERAKRDLQVSLSLSWPGSPVRVSIAAEMTAIDDALSKRAGTVRVCSCGFATNDDDWLDCHLIEHPEHAERGLKDEWPPNTVGCSCQEGRRGATPNRTPPVGSHSH